MPASATRRDPGPRLAIGASLAWALLVASGFWNLIIAPMQVAAATAGDPARVAEVQAWWQARPGGERGPLLVVAPGACACGAQPPQVIAAARSAGVRALVLGPGDAPPPFDAEVVAIDDAGQVRYAGPIAPRLFCSSGHAFALGLLRADPAHAVALVLPSECTCPARSNPQQANAVLADLPDPGASP